MAPVDIVLLLLLIAGAFRGFSKGLVLSVASFVGLVGGIWGASQFSHLAAKQLSEHVNWSVNSLQMASLALTFLAVVVAVHLLAKLLEKVLDMVALGLVNKLAGAVFGGLKTWLILSFLLMMAHQIMGSRSWLPESEQPSVLLAPVESLAPWLSPSFGGMRDAVQDVGFISPQVLENEHLHGPEVEP